MKKVLQRETIQVRDESTVVPQIKTRDREVDRSVVIGRAYDEYCRRRDNDESVNVHDFCSQYSQVYHSLVRQIEVEEYLRENPRIADRVVQTSWPEPGDIVFGCDVVEEIGRGAFARVYLCLQEDIGDRQVVIKVARGGAYEAQTMGRLSHPNIMPVYSVDQSEFEELSGICMPFLGRSTLLDAIDRDDQIDETEPDSQRFREAATRWQKTTDRYHVSNQSRLDGENETYESGAISIMHQVAMGLAHAHEQGVIHGDLKPTNIVLSSDAVPYLVDFNLANDKNSDRVITGGTLAYMAPEQVEAIATGDSGFETDESCDVFSFGVILYQLLYGKLPFDVPEALSDQPVRFEEYLQQFTHSKMSEAETRLRQSEVDGLIAMCIRQDPIERPTMEDVAARLNALVNRDRKPKQRLNKARLAASAGVFVAAFASAAFTIDRRQDRHQIVATSRGGQVDVSIPLENVKEMLEAGKIDEAVEVLRAKSAVLPDSEDARFLLAQANAAIFFDRFDESALREARNLLSSLNRRSPASSYSEWYAMCHVGQKEYDLAEQVYDRLAKDGIASAATWNNLGYIYYRRMFLRGGRIPPDHESYCKLLKEMKAKSRACFEKAIAADPDRWLAYHNLLRVIENEEKNTPECLELAETAAVLSNYQARPCEMAARISSAIYSKTNDTEDLSTALYYLRLAAKGGLDVCKHVDELPEYETLRSSEGLVEIYEEFEAPSKILREVRATMLPEFAVSFVRN